ncbi:PqqD family peptide modification chaperone [Leadbetterella sp. DM7]|uniref:PqqD family peptide modification chaperone n=1 Tax=Leadbetterella sp. DM7 TaxID=3235085 RepID=UPI00349E5DC5
MAYTLNEEKILFTRLGEEGVIYDMEKNEYVSLNETFFSILKYLEEGLEIQAVISRLCEEYEVDEEECRKEVEEAVEKLVERKFILFHA